MQVKSFEGEHWDLGAVQDIRNAFQEYPEADEGVIISTASAPTADFDSALEDLRRDTGKPVSLLIGAEVAAFVLKNGWDLVERSLKSPS